MTPARFRSCGNYTTTWMRRDRRLWLACRPVRARHRRPRGGAERRAPGRGGRAGQVRWLRPAYQAPAETARVTQTALDVAEAADAASLPPWPTAEADRYVALRSLLASTPVRPADLSRHFQRAPTAKVRAMLETLAVLGQARRDSDGRYRM